MNATIASHKDKIDHLLIAASKIEDEEVRAHMAKHLCVVISGLIENSVRSLIDEYATKKSNPNVALFVSKKIKHITNLKEDDIFKLLGLFSEEWAKKFSEMLSSEQKDALDTVVANRHLIAHGGSSGMTYVRIKQLYPQVIQGIELVDKIINE